MTNDRLVKIFLIISWVWIALFLWKTIEIKKVVSSLVRENTWLKERNGLLIAELKECEEINRNIREVNEIKQAEAFRKERRLRKDLDELLVVLQRKEKELKELDKYRFILSLRGR